MAVGLSALFALMTGAICLRTKGVYFIMITMAFAQMVFYAFVSMDEYGADDGLVIEVRSRFPAGIDIENNLVLFIFCYGSLLVVLYLVHRIVNSRFGMVIQGARANEKRMRAIGYNTYLYRLTCYVISGAICGFAGALLGNFTSFISPEMMDWTRSSELMFMVILGGAGSWVGSNAGGVGADPARRAVVVFFHLLAAFSRFVLDCGGVVYHRWHQRHSRAVVSTWLTSFWRYAISTRASVGSLLPTSRASR